MSVHLIVTLHAREDRREDFAQLMAAVKQDLPSAPGCRGVSIYRQAERPLVYTLVEHWDSTAAHQAHLQRMEASGGWAALSAQLAEPPVSAYATAL